MRTHITVCSPGPPPFLEELKCPYFVNLRGINMGRFYDGIFREENSCNLYVGKGHYLVFTVSKVTQDIQEGRLKV